MPGSSRVAETLVAQRYIVGHKTEQNGDYKCRDGWRYGVVTQNLAHRFPEPRADKKAKNGADKRQYTHQLDTGLVAHRNDNDHRNGKNRKWDIIVVVHHSSDNGYCEV